MKKYFVAICAFVLGGIVAVAIVYVLFIGQPKFRLFINETEYKFSDPIVSINGKIYFPAKEFCNAIWYRISWDDDERVVTVSNTEDVVFNDDVYTSQEGVLDNGRKYVFYGTDREFSIKGYLENNRLTVATIFNRKIQEESIKEMAEKLQKLFVSGTPPKDAGISIFYDKKQNALLFKADYYDTAGLLGIPSVVVVNCDDGTVTTYNSEYAL